jgi:choline dehydrogenase
MLSGVGPVDALRARDIPVVAESPGVGQGLQEHLFTIMTHLLNIPSLNRENTPWGVVRHGVNLLLHGKGAATSSFAAAVVFDSPEPRDGPPNFELLYAPYGLVDSEQTKAVTSGTATKVRHDIHDVNLADVNTVTTLLCNLEPKARGTVTLRSANPADSPIIRHEFAGMPEDIDGLIAACRQARGIFESEPMKSLVIREEAPGDTVQSREEWKKYLLATTFGGSHPVSTCRMGNDPLAVVDPQLRARGVTGLRVIDASIMPMISRGNTNAPTIVIAAKGADMIRSDRDSGDRSPP